MAIIKSRLINEKALADNEKKNFILLFGPPNCGKTAIVNAVFAQNK